MSITLVRGGEQPGQGVGYLDDGTMVVVEHAAEQIGTEAAVEITGSLQTSAGRLIFAKLAGARGEEGAGQLVTAVVVSEPAPAPSGIVPEMQSSEATGSGATGSGATPLSVKPPAPTPPVRSPFPPNKPTRNPLRNPRR